MDKYQQKLIQETCAATFALASVHANIIKKNKHLAMATMAHAKSPVRAEAIPTPMASNAFFKAVLDASIEPKEKP